MLQVASIASRWTGACRRSSSVEQELSEAFRAVGGVPPIWLEPNNTIVGAFAGFGRG